jgi:hypothetical protein
MKVLNQIILELTAVLPVHSSSECARASHFGVCNTLRYSKSVSPSSMRGYPLNTSCILKTSCTRLDWQLSFVTQILTQLSPLLFSVRLLSIEKYDEFQAGKEDADSVQWLEFFQPFAHMRQGDTTRTGHRKGSGHGGHAPRHTSRADPAFPKGPSQFPICGESYCAVCCYAPR